MHGCVCPLAHLVGHPNTPRPRAWPCGHPDGEAGCLTIFLPRLCTPLPAVDKTREAEEAARPSEPTKPAQPQATGHPVLLGGVPDDFAEWEVDKVMEDLAPSVQVSR